MLGASDRSARTCSHGFYPGSHIETKKAVQTLSLTEVLKGSAMEYRCIMFSAGTSTCAVGPKGSR